MAVAYSLAVRPAGGDRTWTVVDASYATVGPVEEWLEAHRHLWSPNTVRGYATSLAQWWSFLEQRGEAGRWQDAGVPAVAGFLSWLRNGRTAEHALAAPGEVPSAETLHARLAALISFYQWQEAVHSVPVAGRLLRGRAVRMPSRGLLAHLDARRDPGPSSLVKVRRRRPGRPPLLLPGEIQAIIDGCAAWDDAAGEWRGNLRDRLLFSVSRTAALAAAAKAKSEAKAHAADQAIRRLVRRGEPVTFQAVQREAGVSHAFLYGNPDLRARIEHLRAQARPQPVPATDANGDNTIIQALTSQISHLKKQHRDQTQALHAALEQAHGENLQLRRELTRLGWTGQPATT